MTLSEDYIKKYYDQVNRLNLKTSPKLDAWFIGLVSNAINSSVESIEIINAKFLHSFTTVARGREISSRTPEINWVPELVDLVCFFHDIARFPEAIGNAKLAPIVGFDHGDRGAEMFLNQDLSDCGACVIYKETIFNAIKFHNKMVYKGNDPYAKLVRDADKLDDFLMAEWQLSFGKKSSLAGTITPKVFENFCAHKSVDFIDNKSIDDWIIFFLSWYFDINFPATFYISEEHGVINKYLEILGKYNHSVDTLAKINDVVSFIRSKYSS